MFYILKDLHGYDVFFFQTTTNSIIFDICVTVRHWYNNIKKNRLDATVTDN